MSTNPTGRYSVKSFRIQLVGDGSVVDPSKRDLVGDPALAKALLRDYFRMAEPDQERTVVLLLNTRNRLLSIKELYVGTLDHAMVEPRGILVAALLGGAAGIVIGHNHPSGDPSPSPQDRELTRKLVVGCEAVGIRFLDHIVVGNETETSISFREAGLL